MLESLASVGYPSIDIIEVLDHVLAVDEVEFLVGKWPRGRGRTIYPACSSGFPSQGV